MRASGCWSLLKTVLLISALIAFVEAAVDQGRTFDGARSPMSNEHQLFVNRLFKSKLKVEVEVQPKNNRLTKRSIDHHWPYYRNARGSGCIDPADLPQQFMAWFQESGTMPDRLGHKDGYYNDGGGQKQPTETVDPYSMNEPKICEQRPENGPDTTEMERALCPWEWRVNRDEHRQPKLISEAYCSCRKSRGGTGALCTPIQRDIPVLRRLLCDITTGRYEYVRSLQTITVGCHAVLPRTQRAMPFRSDPHRLI